MVWYWSDEESTHFGSPFLSGFRAFFAFAGIPSKVVGPLGLWLAKWDFFDSAYLFMGFQFVDERTGLFQMKQKIRLPFPWSGSASGWITATNTVSVISWVTTRSVSSSTTSPSCFCFLTESEWFRVSRNVCSVKQLLLGLINALNLFIRRKRWLSFIKGRTFIEEIASRMSFAMIQWREFHFFSQKIKFSHRG